MIGNDAFQEVDMVGITRPISKHNFLIKDVEDLDGVLRQAFYIARSGSREPVVVDICKNALLGKVVNGHKARLLKSYHPDVKLDETEAHALLVGLLSAKRPVIKVGGGVISSNASRELRQLSINTNSLHPDLYGAWALVTQRIIRCSWGCPGECTARSRQLCPEERRFHSGRSVPASTTGAVREFGRRA